MNLNVLGQWAGLKSLGQWASESSFGDLVMTWWERFLTPIDDPGSRLFYLHLLSAFLLVIFFSLYQAQRAGSPRKFLNTLSRSVFNLRYWWNGSTRIDYQVYFLNSVLKILIFIPFLVSSYWISKFVLTSLISLHGDFLGISPSSTALVLFSVAAFVYDDFLRFFHHFIMHKVPWLWEFHKIHHSARVLTPVTLYRAHPLESAMAAVRNSLSLGVLTGVFIFLFESQFSLITLFGVNLFGMMFNLLGANLRHSHIPLSFGFLEGLFISPKQHQIHHSSSPEHRGRNLGVSLAIWDRLAGTLVFSNQLRNRRLRFGMGRQLSEASLSQQILMPFNIIYKRLLGGQLKD